MTINNIERVAIVHDWLVAMRGGEKVLEAICEIYPDADLYTIYCLRDKISRQLSRMRIKTSFIQRLVFSSKQDFRFYLPLFPLAAESFDMRNYDLIISTSHCVAKGVIPGPKAPHICYCHTPMRYAWDFEDDYFGRMKSIGATKGLIVLLMNYLRKWDNAASSRVNEFIANSQNTANRIKRYYGRESTIIYPPVETDYFTPDARQKTGGFFLIISALVPYKRIDIAIEAFNKTGDQLKIVGNGPLRKKLQKKAHPNIEFLGWADKEILRELYRGCDALVFTQEEDFGIAAVEAQACGRPVIAYAKGGALEVVINKKTGLYFSEQTSDSLISALQEFKALEFDPDLIRENALRFNNKEAFKENIRKYVTGNKLTEVCNAFAKTLV